MVSLTVKKLRYKTVVPWQLWGYGINRPQPQALHLGLGQLYSIIARRPWYNYCLLYTLKSSPHLSNLSSENSDETVEGNS